MSDEKQANAPTTSYRRQQSRKYAKANSAETDSPGGEPSEALSAVAHLAKAHKNSWILDSGATEHMTFSRECFSSYNELEEKRPVTVGGERVIWGIGTGEVICRKTDGTAGSVTLKNVLLVPGLGVNLFSVSVASDRGKDVHFSGEMCQIVQGNKIILSRRKEGKLYHLNIEVLASEAYVTSSNDLWHKRYGHVHHKRLLEMAKKNIVVGMSIKDDWIKRCEPCTMAKHASINPTSSGRTRAEVFGHLHSDVCGPMRTKSLG